MKGLLLAILAEPAAPRCRVAARRRWGEGTRGWRAVQREEACFHPCHRCHNTVGMDLGGTAHPCLPVTQACSGRSSASDNERST
jgi:hypothetical protein